MTFYIKKKLIASAQICVAYRLKYFGKIRFLINNILILYSKIIPHLCKYEKNVMNLTC